MLRRFDSHYLRDFRSPITINPAAIIQAEEATPPPPPPPPIFSETELEQAKELSRKQGYAEGIEAEKEQANTDAVTREKETMDAVQRISFQLMQLAITYKALVEQQVAELSELVLAIAKKVAGDALDARGVDTIVALVAQCLPVMIDKPKIVIELHTDSVEGAKSKIVPLLSQHGLEGDVQFRVTNNLGPHDVRIDWGNGQATRSSEVLWGEIEALLQHIKIIPELPDPNQQPTTT